MYLYKEIYICVCVYIERKGGGAGGGERDGARGGGRASPSNSTARQRERSIHM